MSLINKEKDTKIVGYQSRISFSTSTSPSPSLSSRPRSKVRKVKRNLSFSTRCQKRDSSSTRLPLNKSHNLISLISQFENLDSVTASKTGTGFSPHGSRELSRRQKDQITNQCSGCPVLEISKGVEETQEKVPEDVPSQYDHILVYSKPLKLQSKVNSGLDVEKSQNQQSNSNFVDEATIKDCQGCRRRLNFPSVASKQVVTNDKKRVVSMQEKIRFFDGSASLVERNKSRFYGLTQAKSKLGEVQKSRFINEKISSGTLQKQITAQTSTFDPKAINQLSAKKGSPNDCDFSESTETLKIPDRRKGKADFMNKIIIRDLEQNFEENQKIKNGSLNTKHNMKSLSRKPSTKIEALFRQSMDQIHNTSENNKSHMNGAYLSPKIKLEFRKRDDQENQMVTQKELNAKNEAKFLNTKQKFEIKNENFLSDKQDDSALQPLKQDSKMARGFIDKLSTYSSESLKRYRNIKTDLVSTEVAQNLKLAETPLIMTRTKKAGVAQENLPMKNSTLSSTPCGYKVKQSTPANTQGAVFFLPEKMSPIASSGFVGEKVKKFENIKSLRVSGGFPANRSITRRLNRSLRGFFEYWGSHEKMRGKNESTSIYRLGDSYEEFQCIENQRKKSKGTLSPNVAPSKNPLKAKNIEKYPEKVSSLDDVDIWIIKKVNCGLKQPKPLRAVEIESMALLCSPLGSGSKTSRIPS